MITFTTKTMSSSRRVRKNRRGVSVVELAVCLPVLALLTMAAIETTSMIYFKQSLEVTAYEGARVALISSAGSDNVLAQCQQIIDDRRIQDAAISVSPDVASAAPGTIINVTVTAPCRNNGFFTTMFYADRTFSSSVEMMKEN